MKARYTNFNSSLTFEIEGDGVKAIFKELASLQEVFDSERKCGVCGGDYRFQFRQVDDFTYYELACLSPGCRARFAFGQAKKGGALFPKRKDEDGRPLDHGGWTKYVKPGEEQHEPAEPARPAQRATAPAAERTLPTEMLAFYERIEKNRGLFANACSAMQDQMIERNPHKGPAAYDRIADSVSRRWPNGIRDMKDIKIVMLELWDAYQSL